VAAADGLKVMGRQRHAGDASGLQCGRHSNTISNERDAAGRDIAVIGRFLATAEVLVCLATTVAAQTPSVTREVVIPPGASGSTPFSPGVRIGNIIYVSGQVAGDVADISGQTTGALKKVQAIVEAAGATMTNVDKCTVFLTRQADFAPMNEVWRNFFPASPPARSTVIVAALARPEFLIEVECVAHK
jgi:2-iminobutanoate/2-iminopropanoate deaminase